MRVAGWRSAATAWLGSVAAVCILHVAGGVGIAHAAPGDLDRAFGQAGVIDVTPQALPSVYGVVDDMAIGPKDEILVLYDIRRSCPRSTQCQEIAVAKYSPDGAKEADFVISAGPTADLGMSFALTVDRTGRILVATERRGVVEIARLTPDGALDPTFGTAGRVILSASRSLSVADLAVGPGGRIFLLADELTFGGTDPSDVGIFAMKEDGSRDFGFGFGSGAVMFDSGGPDSAGELAFSGGEIATSVATGSRLQLVRFNGDGTVVRASSPRIAGKKALFLGPILGKRRGGAWIVGWSLKGTAVLGLRSNWTVDRRFGRHGSAVSPKITSPQAEGDPAGRLIVAGSVTERLPGYEIVGTAVTRRLSDGSIDRTFSGGRLVRIPLLEGEDRTERVGIQSSGRIVLLIGAFPECVRSCANPPRYFLTGLVGGMSHVRCHGVRATVVGTRASETLTGTAHRDVIAGLDGGDTISGRGGDDLICGGRGFDFLNGGRGHDRLFGGHGDDSIEGGPGQGGRHR